MNEVYRVFDETLNPSEDEIYETELSRLIKVCRGILCYLEPDVRLANDVPELAAQPAEIGEKQ